MQPNTKSILKPLFEEMNKAYGKGKSIARDMESERLFMATEGGQEAGKFGKKPKKRDDR